MSKGKKYDVSGLVEVQYEPGSRGRVLKNLPGITNKRDMDRVEARAQLRALERLIKTFDQGHRFTAADICTMHKIWLGTIYPWAGRYRTVNISKGAFSFATAGHIPKLMHELERGPLRRYTPCRFTSRKQLAEALAVVHVDVVHVELMLIHPFWEGNGRVGRLLAVLMGLQAGLPPLDFGNIRGRTREDYFAAVRAGIEREYVPMQRLFTDVIERTVQTDEGPGGGRRAKAGRPRSPSKRTR